MNVASKELCQELYELSGWITDTKQMWFFPDNRNDNPILVNRPFKPNGYNESSRCPAYDLGYLLRKLPQCISIGQMITSDSLWVATCTKFHPNKHPYCAADTPENAVVRLAIALIKEGVITV